MKLPVRARHSAPSMGSTPFSGACTRGKLALHRCDQSITHGRNIFQYAAGKGDGRSPPAFARGAPQPPDDQPDQVRKLIALLPQHG